MACVIVGFLGLIAVVWWWFSSKAQLAQHEAQQRQLNQSALNAEANMIFLLSDKMRTWREERLPRTECIDRGTTWVLERVPHAAPAPAAGMARVAFERAEREVSVEAAVAAQHRALPQTLQRCATCGQALIRTGIEGNDDRDDECEHCRIKCGFFRNNDALENRAWPFVLGLAAEMRVWLQEDVRYQECKERGAIWFRSNAAGACTPDMTMAAYEWALYELRRMEFLERHSPAGWRWLHRPLR